MVGPFLVDAVRRFLLVADRARSSPDVPLDDLPGAGGRWDVVARFVSSALLISHGVRPDTVAMVVLRGPPDAPRALRVRGHAVKGLRPDERSTAATLSKGLDAFATPIWQGTAAGIDLSRKDLADILDDEPGPVVLLDPDGDDAAPPADGLFVIGDDQGLSEEDLELVRSRADQVMSLGPVALQADQCVTVLHNLLDRDGDRV